MGCKKNALAALIGAFLIQIATNFANDMFDFQKGADTQERLGPTRAAQAGLLSVAQLRRGIVVSFAIALGTGIYLTFIAGPAVVLIGLASMAAGCWACAGVLVPGCWCCCC